MSGENKFFQVFWWFLGTISKRYKNTKNMMFEYSTCTNVPVYHIPPLSLLSFLLGDRRGGGVTLIQTKQKRAGREGTRTTAKNNTGTTWNNTFQSDTPAGRRIAYFSNLPSSYPKCFPFVHLIMWLFTYTKHVFINSLYLHTYTDYVHTHIHTYVRTYVHTYIHTYVHAYIHTYIHTYRQYNTYSYIFKNPPF